MLNAEQIIKIINETLSLNLDPSKTSPDEPLKSLGLDSLDVFNVLIEVEALTGIKVPDEDIKGLSTIRRLVEYFS
jgi:acyl carrier protein